MFASLKLWKLSSALKSRDVQTAYSAVRELGRLGGPKAMELLLECLEHRNGVSRAAARELGMMGGEAVVDPLIGFLGDNEVNQAVVEALIRVGSVAAEPLIKALGAEDVNVRTRAAQALGELGESRAVDRLVDLVQSDDSYAVRAAGATALGQIKDPRAVWVLVATLKLRDETSPELRESLEILRTAASLAMRKIGDPLAPTQKTSAPGELEVAVDKLEESVVDSDVHPRLISALDLLSEEELIGVMKELVAASEEISWAKLEDREPLLRNWFKTYEQRRGIAQQVGDELHRRGGKPLLDRVLTSDLDHYTSIKNWWADY